ncbi:Hsp20/alpha crystallin family protein [Limosilactobacillus sp. RRLNB_1_1]|uniref:Hsp20/alpha crystallin family protein n=1 Tax=Limosilactobacillus albertensis TaxID=2759752 RepID=A0A7W3Y7K9_9LACO|nr:Hsp20/alpha crystallin family protein [Limosilactobacillus albertensis]MBB1068789.1 Hsp20/alpha crystallin family protein [Limosilactobacillus albertensis]MCD7117775.1 Hsp20/alpha crystallin family protein [Limosilactobacillus albertensis]MCD7129225.1 Hsp20/alpha crystallin family protein [Limosilactobacillus albertensis]
MANELQNRNNFFDNLMNMRNWMNDDFFSNLTPVADHMKTDVTEDDKGYTVKIDMPGFDKKDIHISYANNILTVTGRRDTFDDDADKEGNVLHSERRYGQMSRQYRLPDVNRKDVKAQYNDGVLTISLPKLNEKDDDENRIDID